MAKLPQSWLKDPQVDTLPPDVRDHLFSLGVDPAAFVAYVSGESPPADSVDFTSVTDPGPDMGKIYAELTGTQYDPQAPAPTAGPIETRRTADRDEAVAEAVKKAATQGYNFLSEDEKDVVAEANIPPSVLDAMFAVGSMNMPIGAEFAFQDGGALAGIDPALVDWSSLLSIVENLDLYEFNDPPDRADNETDSQYAARVLSPMFQAGPSQRTQYALASYATQQGHYASQIKDGEWLLSDIMAVADKHRMSSDQVKWLGYAGKSAGIESLDEVAALYAWAQDTGLGVRDLPVSKKGALFGTDRVRDITMKRIDDNTWGVSVPPPPAKNYDIEVAAGVTVRRTGPHDRGTTEITPGALVGVYRAHKANYGNEMVARLALHDRALAERLYADPYSLTIEELRKVDGFIGGAEAAYDWDPFGADWLAQRLAGGSQETTVQVDRAGVREAARTIASSWNMSSLSDAMLDKIVSSVVGPQIAAAQRSLPNPFNPKLNDGLRVVDSPSPGAATTEALRGTAEYGELFGNMADGEDELTYASRFDQESQQMLGDKNLDVVRAGMRSGSRNTVGQAALFSGEGSDNSTFRQRLARIGEAFREMT